MTEEYYATFVGGPWDGKVKQICGAPTIFRVARMPDFSMRLPDGPPTNEVIQAETYRLRAKPDGPYAIYDYEGEQDG